MTAKKPRKGLSKTLYIKGLQCHKCLHLNKYHPELKDEISPRQQAIFDSGTEVGLLAQQLFSGGIEVPYEGLGYSEQLNMTKEEIEKGTENIYEAAFSFEGIFLKVDILHKGKDGWEIYEVKSSNEMKDVYCDDVSVQYYVLNGCGLDVSKVFLVHLNREYVRQGDIEIDELFVAEDLTETALEKQNFVKNEVRKMKEMLKGDEPDIDIGSHCKKPYTCDYFNYCRRHIPENSVFSLAGNGPDQYELYNQGIIRLKDVPLNILPRTQQIQLEGYLYKRNVFDRAAVEDFMDTLWYPMSFLDFETNFTVPVPIFDGMRPYQQIPFQYSLHVQDKENGELKHFEYLGPAGKDPRREFIETLIRDIPVTSSVLVYNMTFEKGRLEELKQSFPEYEDKIQNIISNMRDLMSPFRSKHIYFHQMNGSFSIKKVLPVLVPELSYENMDISEGGMASDAWLMMQNMKDPKEIERTRKALLEYCKLDTLAMVKILEKIKTYL